MGGLKPAANAPEIQVLIISLLVLLYAARRVYIFQGTRDSIVDPKAANVIYDFYSEFLTDPGSQMLLKDDIACTHAVVSDHTGTECGETNEDIYIENCDFDRYACFPAQRNAVIVCFFQPLRHA